MTADGFRHIALSMPGAIESSHMNHPDFRAGGKIFATITADGVWGVVMLTPEQQSLLLISDRETFEPAAGAWGRAGSTKVMLKVARQAIVKHAMALAWQNKTAGAARATNVMKTPTRPKKLTATRNGRRRR